MENLNTIFNNFKKSPGHKPSIEDLHQNDKIFNQALNCLVEYTNNKSDVGQTSTINSENLSQLIKILNEHDNSWKKRKTKFLQELLGNIQNNIDTPEKISNYIRDQKKALGRWKFAKQLTQSGAASLAIPLLASFNNDELSQLAIDMIAMLPNNVSDEHATKIIQHCAYNQNYKVKVNRIQADRLKNPEKSMRRVFRTLFSILPLPWIGNKIYSKAFRKELRIKRNDWRTTVKRWIVPIPIIGWAIGALIYLNTRKNHQQHTVTQLETNGKLKLEQESTTVPVVTADVTAQKSVSEPSNEQEEKTDEIKSTDIEEKYQPQLTSTDLQAPSLTPTASIRTCSSAQSISSVASSLPVTPSRLDPTMDKLAVTMQKIINQQIESFKRQVPYANEILARDYLPTDLYSYKTSASELSITLTEEDIKTFNIWAAQQINIEHIHKEAIKLRDNNARKYSKLEKKQKTQTDMLSDIITNQELLALLQSSVGSSSYAKSTSLASPTPTEHSATLEIQHINGNGITHADLGKETNDGDSERSLTREELLKMIEEKQKAQLNVVNNYLSQIPSSPIQPLLHHNLPPVEAATKHHPAPHLSDISENTEALHPSMLLSSPAQSSSISAATNASVLPPDVLLATPSNSNSSCSTPMSQQQFISPSQLKSTPTGTISTRQSGEVANLIDLLSSPSKSSSRSRLENNDHAISPRQLFPETPPSSASHSRTTSIGFALSPSALNSSASDIVSASSTNMIAPENLLNSSASSGSIINEEQHHPSPSALNDSCSTASQISSAQSSFAPPAALLVTPVNSDKNRQTSTTAATSIVSPSRLLNDSQTSGASSIAGSHDLPHSATSTASNEPLSPTALNSSLSSLESSSSAAMPPALAITPQSASSTSSAAEHSELLRPGQLLFTSPSDSTSSPNALLASPPNSPTASQLSSPLQNLSVLNSSTTSPASTTKPRKSDSPTNSDSSRENHGDQPNRSASPVTPS